MSESYQHPRVGTGVWIRRKGKVLLGFRTWKHAPNTWAPPGGKLDKHETPEACAIRETREETGLEIRDPRLIGVTNDVYPEVDQHYVTLYFLADWRGGEAELTEPEKFDRWEWFEWGKLPEPLLLSTKHFIELGIDPLAL